MPVIRLVRVFVLTFFIFISGAMVGAVRAAEWPEIPRRLPPKGIALAETDQKNIEAALAHLQARIAKLPGFGYELTADVEVYAKAVHFALLHDEFYKPTDVKKAVDLLAAGEKRADELEKAKPSWTTQHGLVVRAYRSKIDNSVQPYGLEIPADVDFSKPVPLYVWLHGRGDTSTDMHFIAERQSRKGQIAPPGAIVLHPFGRQCLGFKSAGETDVFEAITSVRLRYKIDPDRVILMGFSMGGAGAWHIGAHHASSFAAVHAGAGFVDVARYQHLTPDRYPAWYEQKLWGVYDVPDYVRNLFNTTMVAYGGEIDPQRASAQIMAEAFKAEGHELTFITGPKMPHRYDPTSLAHIMELMHEAQVKGRNQFPDHITLQTRTTCYSSMFWASITGLGQHWEDARLDANAMHNGPNDFRIKIETKNVTHFTLRQPWRDAPKSFDASISVDGSDLKARFEWWHVEGEFVRDNGKWKIAPEPPMAIGFPLRKRPFLQGPIDDAFTEPFLVVMPSGTCASPNVQKWMEFESRHLQDRWRAVFRGELRIKRDDDVTEDDIANYNLLLWGDPQANKLIARIGKQLPVLWDDRSLALGTKKFDAATHLPLLIYPNPLRPIHYVVLNSGPTFREADDRTNSLQNPKLPDWAIVDVTTRPDEKAPGKIEDAGFFDEEWKFKK